MAEFVDYYNHHQQHPTRFATTHDPKILELPESAWINEPRNEDHAA